jgi:hypothetical protein
MATQDHQLGELGIGKAEQRRHRQPPSLKACKTSRSSAMRSAALSLLTNRSYVAHRIRGGFSGG